MSIKSTFAGALLAVSLAAPAMAAAGPAGFAPAAFGPQRGAWEQIGAREVSFRAERDVIVARGADRHRQLMVCVYRQPIRVFDMDVRFANGGHQDVGVRSIIGAGQCTRAIDLNGHRRNIHTVSLSYKAVNGRPFGAHFGGRLAPTALVRVFAR